MNKEGWISAMTDNASDTLYGSASETAGEIALPVEQTRAEDTLGASDAAGALGLDQYNPPISVWRRLRGMATNDEKPAFVQEAARWGQVLEPIVRGQYALQREAMVFVPEASLVLDGWLRCTPDGVVVAAHRAADVGAYAISKHAIDTGGLLYDEGTRAAGDRIAAIRAGTAGLYQGKTCSAYKRDEWAIGVPPAYEVQVRVEMAVTDLPWCDVLCLVGGQKLVGPYRVERDAALEDRILTDLRAFWRAVKEGVEPSPDHTAAWREHITERMQPTKIALVPTAGQSALLLQWKAARAELAADKRKEAELKNRLLLELSAAGATAFDLGPDGRVTAYRSGARSDWKAYAISLGGAAKAPDQFRGNPGSFTLRAPWSDDDGE